MPRPFSRQIETIPEYEPEMVSDTVPTVQSNPPPPTNRPQASSSASKALVKRPENQTVPVASNAEDFIHIPEQVVVDKTIVAGIVILRLPLNSFDRSISRYANFVCSTFTRET